VEGAMVGLEEQTARHVAAVAQAASDYQSFTDNVDALGDPEDWLKLIEVGLIYLRVWV